MKHRAHTGFTLIELMITIAIFSIIIMFAAPSFSDIILRDRLASTSNSLLSAINFARTQAITHNQRITLCPSIDRMQCVSSPKADDWGYYWIVFQDTGTSSGAGTVGVVDKLSTLGDDDWDESVIKVYDIVSNHDKIHADTAIRPYISFSGDGSPRDANYAWLDITTSRFALCALGKHDAGARVIALSRSGRANIRIYDEENTADKTFVTAACPTS